MNWIVIAIGTALVLVLTAASVGPYFVDWTAYRDTIEANASRLIGVGVTIDGDAEVRILPSPRIVVHNVGLGVGDAPLVTARTVDLDVALMPLLSGELRVKQLRLDAPHVDVSISPAGTIDFPPLQVDDGIQSLFTAEDVTVESITVEDGQIELRDSRTGRTHTVEGLALNGNARSLTGPFTAEGRAEIGGAPATVRVAGGQLEAGTMPLSVRVTPQDANAEMSFEGAIVPRAEAPSVRGELTVSAMAGTVPFSLSGGIAADLSEIVFTRGTLSYGAPANAIELTAAASLSLIDNTPAVLALSARQLDLDRLDRALFGSDTPTLRPPAETVEGIMEHLGPLYSLLMGQGGSAREVSVGLDLGAVVVGGALVEEVSLAARSNGTTFTIERAEAVFPGDSTAEFSGTLTGGVRGSLRLSAAQPSVLARWWSGAAAPNPLGGTIDPILLETDLSISQDAIDANRLSLRIGAAAASGRITYVRTERPRLELSLASPRLTLEGVAGALSLFGTATTLTGPLPDLVLDLSAQEVLIDEIAGAAVNIDGTLIEDTLTIDAIAAEDLAGATVFASGTIGSVSTAPVGTISGTLIMTDGARLRTALEAFDTASPIIPWLRARLPLLTPADVRFSVAGGVDPNTPALDFEASGLLAGTDFVVSGSTTTILADWAQTPMDLQAEALSPESATLLAQLGLEALPSGTPGRIELSLNGAPAEGLSTSAAANLLGVEATFLGTLQLADGLTPQGDVSLNIATFTPLLTALELEAPDPGPFTATAQLSAQDQTANTITAREVTGSLGAQPFRGSLTWSALGLGGALAVEEVDVGALAALVLGENAFLADPAEPAPWPNSAFSDPIFAGVDVTIAAETERLLMGPYTIEDAQFELSLSDDGLVIDGGAGTLMGGALAGTLTLLREGPQAALTSDIAVLGATLPQLWQESGAPTQGGRFDLTATAASSGFTVAGLVANLSGEGSVVAQEVGVTGITTAPFTPPAAQGDAPLTEAAVRSELDDHLDAGAITLQTLDAPFTIDGGVMRFETITGRLTSSDGSASETATASIDLSTSTLTGTIDVPLGVQDAPDLSASATFSGSLTAPQRTLDVSSLVAWLNLKALEEQVEAVEAQNEALEDEANALEPAPLAGDQAPEDGTPPPAGNAIDAGPDGTGEDAAEAQTGAATPQTEPATPQSQDVPLPPPAPALPDRANAGAVGN